MDYTVHSKQIQDAIDFERRNQLHTASNKAFSERMKNAAPEQAGMSVLYGYVLSLWEIADDPQVALKLDLTYATVGNLAGAIAYEFSAGMRSPQYTLTKNMEIAEKTIAAYLMFLAANEHGMKIKVKKKDDLTIESLKDTMSWVGYDITVGTVFAEADLLKVIRGKTEYRDGRYYIYLKDICEAYRKLTGHELREDGVEDAECRFE